ncbi:MAG: diguanylate cyclase [Planctomycetota bacterium]
MWLDILIAISCAGLGLSCGWAMRVLFAQPSAADLADEREQRSTASYPTTIASSTSAETLSPESNDSADPSVVQAVAGRLRDFAVAFAGHIDEHQSTVEEISEKLQVADLSNVPPVAVDAIEQLIQANELMHSRLESTQAELRQQTKQLQSARQKAQTDALTEIGNRGVFDEQLKARTTQAVENVEAAGFLMLMDVDHFKNFNDLHGHQAGDEVLRVLARMLETRLGPHGAVMRYGGEEFAAFLDVTSLAEALDLIETIREAIGRREIKFDNKRLKVTASIGVGQMDEQENGTTWLQRVDEALYQSKEVGRNCTHYWHEGEMHRVSASAPSAGDADSAGVDEMLLEARQMASEAAMATEETESEAASTADDTSTHQIQRLDLSGIDVALMGERPKALRYLPDRETMNELIEEIITQHDRSGLTHHMMAVRITGHPGSATMRSVLQLIRTVVGHQDRIGCLDGSTILISMPELTHTQTLQRAEQVCAAAGSIGITLAAPARTRHGEVTGECLSIGIAEIPASWDDPTESTNGSSPTTTLQRQAPTTEQIDGWINEVVAVAQLAATKPAAADEDDNAAAADDDKILYPVLQHRLQ